MNNRGLVTLSMHCIFHSTKSSYSPGVKRLGARPEKTIRTGGDIRVGRLVPVGPQSSRLTCLRRCTRRPRVETSATEKPVRPWVLGGGPASEEGWPSLCGSWGPIESKSSSTRPSMSCSRSRLDRVPLREMADPSSGPGFSGGRGAAQVFLRLRGAAPGRPWREEDMRI